jgi:hypothetical protein
MPALIEQLIPAGTLVTVPAPVPAPLTVNARNGTNDACTPPLAETIRLHGLLLPLHAPLQLENTDPELGVAVSTTAAPSPKLAEHCPVTMPAATVQLSPAGELVTVPLPAPAPEMVTTRAGSTFADTDRGPDISTVHVVSDPLQSPSHRSRMF